MTNLSRPETAVRSRREFLDSSLLLTTSAAAAAVFSQIAGIQNAVAQESRIASPATDDEFKKLADQFLLDPNINYLNHASIGTIPEPVQEARKKYLDLCETNPWLYLWGGQWDELREQVRSAAARFLGCDSTELAITHNTTEMFNTLAHGLSLETSDEVLFSTLCHVGASMPFSFRGQQGFFQARSFPFPLMEMADLTEDKIVDIYAQQIRPETRLLLLPHLDNTVGVRHPIGRISKMARERGVEFVAVDAAQTAGMLPLDCQQMDIDFLATSGHKWINGPKGTGLVFVSHGLQEVLQPMWVTWGQAKWPDSARRYEDYGTRNLPEVLALGDAISLTQALSDTKRETRLKDLWTFTRDLVDQHDTLEWNSPHTWELSGSLYSIRVRKPVDELAQDLFQNHGIVVRAFSSGEPEHLNNLRVSPNVFTAKDQIRQLIELIA